jgi:uncharacterized protein
MRRAEREITDPAAVDAILAEAPLLFLSFHDEPAPYVVPVCFGRDGDTLYVHSAPTGTKIDLLEANPSIGFCAATAMTLTGGPAAAAPGVEACRYGARGCSVSGTATARVVEDEDERRRGLDAIMRHYLTVPGGPAAGFTYAPATLARTCIIALRIDTVRAKCTG